MEIDSIYKAMIASQRDVQLQNRMYQQLLIQGITATTTSNKEPEDLVEAMSFKFKKLRYEEQEIATKETEKYGRKRK